MKRPILAIRSEVARRPRLALAYAYGAVALLVGYLIADPGDRAGYLFGVAFAVSAAIVLLFALELEEDR